MFVAALRLVVKQGIWLPVDEICDISIQGESSGLYRERVASSNSCFCIWSEVVRHIRLEFRNTDCGSLEDIIRVEGSRVRTLVKNFFHRLQKFCPRLCKILAKVIYVDST